MKLKYITIFLITIFLIVSVLVFNSCQFSQKVCLQYLNESKNEHFDMVIVPGVPLKDGKWDRVMKGRVYWSKYLYDAGIAKNIMYSGSDVYTPFYEAEVMAMYAEAIGIPKEHIYTETKAEHSTENVYYSYYKAKKLGFHKIALASDPFQTKLLSTFILERVSPDVKLLPFVTDTLEKMNPDMKDPDIAYKTLMVKDFVSLPDRQGFFERLRGTRGLNIDTTAYR